MSPSPRTSPALGGLRRRATRTMAVLTAVVAVAAAVGVASLLGAVPAEARGAPATCEPGSSYPPVLPPPECWDDPTTTTTAAVGAGAVPAGGALPTTGTDRVVALAQAALVALGIGALARLWAIQRRERRSAAP